MDFSQLTRSSGCLFLAVVYIVIAILQCAGVYSLLSKVWDLPLIIAAILTIIVGPMPVLGTLAGFFGLHYGLRFGWAACLAIYGIPLAVAIIGSRLSANRV